MGRDNAAPGRDAFIYLIFFLSGFPALTYQIVWQRSLFTIYGVNIESITVVVAAFMLGLGLGSILGGRLSKDPRIPVLAAFGVAELTIGVFGLFSLRLFDLVGSYTLGASPLATGLLTFSLVLIPTLMMGATLPLLVTYLVKRSSNVGKSTGSLYFFNTLGSAFASVCAALFLMKTFGKHGGVMVAAILNLTVAASALAFHFMHRSDGTVDAAGPPSAGPEAGAGGRTGAPAIPFLPAILIVFLSGYIALSYEIVWLRVYAIGLAGPASTFPLVLGMYLAGIAWGSAEARRFCPDGYNRERPVHIRALAGFALCANMAGFLLVPVAARAFQGGLAWVAFVLLVPAAGLLGATLPLVSHMAIPPDGRSGTRLSYLYFSNIIGSTLGSYATGFLLMDAWPLGRIALFLALAGLLMTAVLVVPCRLVGGRSAAAIAALVVLATVFIVGRGPLYDRIYERLVFKGGFSGDTRFAHVVEDKSGVVMVSGDGTVYGDGVYDGCFNTDIVHDTNLIVRPYSLNAFHKAPKDVLMVGLSSGSWAQVVANNPDVERLTVVEINPGYARVIPDYPMVASLMKNPKVELVVDDGRRWLTKNPARRFDAIVMNTTWHWRAFTSNLLSVEFLKLARAHLKEGGIFFYNSTFSPEAQRTGAAVFPYAYRYINFMLVSGSPISVDKDRLTRTLEGYRIDGRPVIDLSGREGRAKLGEILAVMDRVDEKSNWWTEMESRGHILARTAGLRLITDDNMLTEWQGI